MKKEDIDKLKRLIEDIEMIIESTNLPMSSQFHLIQIQTKLPDKIKEVKEILKCLTQ